MAVDGLGCRSFGWRSLMSALSQLDLSRLTEEDRKNPEVMALLEALEEGSRRNPLWSWRPYEEQRAYFETPRVELGTVLLAGGNRSGKTEGGVVWDIIQAVDAVELPGELGQYKRFSGPTRGRVISPSFKQQNLVALDKFRKLAPQDSLKGGGWQKAFSKSEQMLYFQNGSWIQFLTAEQDVDVHAGIDLDWVHFDEEPTPPEKGRLLWQENLARLVDRGGEMRFTMTPLLGLTFTHDEIYDRRHEDPSIRVIQLSMEDNPHLSAKARTKYLGGLSEDELKARRDGMFVHFAGRVFDDFRDQDHITDPPSREHVKGLTVVEGIDPGVRRTAVVWVGFDKDGSAVVFDELYMPDATVDRVAARVRERREHWGVTPLFTVIDPSARNRTLTDAEHVEGEYMRHGIPTVHGQNDVEAGILMWKRRLQAKPSPAFLVSSDCRRLLWEMGRYRIDDRADGRFAVVKRDDHIIDATRYCLMSMPWDGDQVIPDVRRRHGWTPRFDPNKAPPASVLTAGGSVHGPFGDLL